MTDLYSDDDDQIKKCDLMLQDKYVNVWKKIAGSLTSQKDACGAAFFQGRSPPEKRLQVPEGLTRFYSDWNSRW